MKPIVQMAAKLTAAKGINFLIDAFLQARFGYQRDLSLHYEAMYVLAVPSLRGGFV